MELELWFTSNNLALKAASLLIASNLISNGVAALISTAVLLCRAALDSLDSSSLDNMGNLSRANMDSLGDNLDNLDSLAGSKDSMDSLGGGQGNLDNLAGSQGNLDNLDRLLDSSDSLAAQGRLDSLAMRPRGSMGSRLEALVGF